MGWQPYLHEAVLVVRAPSLALSGRDGQFRGGADGFFHGDVRALSGLLLTVDGTEPVPIAVGTRGADRAIFTAVARGLGEHSPDPAVTVTRERQVRDGELSEQVTLANAGRGEVECRVEVAAEVDLTSMAAVKSGAPANAPVPAGGDGPLSWSGSAVSVTLEADPTPAYDGATMRYGVTLPPGGSWTCRLRCRVRDAVPQPFHAPAAPSWGEVTLQARDPRLERWWDRSLVDLDALRLVEGADAFLAAGAPWYLTLFGRDSLWAARMLLPVSTTPAEGTLRVLARRQGTRENPDNAEQPGKILHEIRREQGDLSLPPLYFGTIDATALWIILLHDAWRWGMSEVDVRSLIPALEKALAWMRDYGDSDGDGLLEYVDESGRGLANQGWKDSGDSVQWPDGRLAEPPIALCEVQAYAYEAAMAGADLLEEFGRAGAAEWRDWAAALQRRFRERFWVSDAAGAFPAIALDGSKRPVASATSNLGHLLGTGLLDERESALVAERLTGPDLAAGFGVCTLGGSAARFNQLGYHTGSVWPHDTAIALRGLCRAGRPADAARFLPRLLRAADAFAGRLPELYSGAADEGWNVPAPYPAACRPQAWSAAAVITVLSGLLGLAPDGGRLRADPALPPDLLPLRLTGVRVGAQAYEVAVDAGGSATVRAL